MSFLNIIRNAGQSPTSAYGQFLIAYKRTEETIHGFFEGPEDESVYRNFLEARKPNNSKLFTYRCANKNDVYYVYGLMDFSTFDRTRAIFFVDKDLSDFLFETHPTDTNIFVTGCYSVENYLVTEAMLERALREILHVSNRQKIEAIQLCFRTQYNFFCREIIHVMAWVLVVRTAKLPANLNNINLDKLFEIADDLQISRSQTFAKVSDLHKYLADKTGVAITKKQLSDCTKAAVLLRGYTNPKVFIRGKFDLWFFIKFLSKVKKELELTRQAGDHRCQNLPSLKECVATFGPRLQMPEELDRFLKIIWNSASSRN